MKINRPSISFNELFGFLCLFVGLGLSIIYYTYMSDSIDCGDLEYRFLGYNTVSCCKFDEKMELKIGKNNYPYWFKNNTLVYCNVYNESTKEIIKVVKE